MEERRVCNKEEKQVNEGHSLMNVPLYFSIYRFVRDIATLTLLRNQVQFDFCYCSGHVCSDDGQQHHCHSVVNCSEQTDHLLNALLVMNSFLGATIQGVDISSFQYSKAIWHRQLYIIFT